MVWFQDHLKLLRLFMIVSRNEYSQFLYYHYPKYDLTKKGKNIYIIKPGITFFDIYKTYIFLKRTSPLIRFIKRDRKIY